jgi:hypothetical protein
VPEGPEKKDIYGTEFWPPGNPSVLSTICYSSTHKPTWMRTTRLLHRDQVIELFDRLIHTGYIEGSLIVFVELGEVTINAGGVRVKAVWDELMF